MTYPGQPGQPDPSGQPWGGQPQWQQPQTGPQPQQQWQQPEQQWQQPQQPAGYPQTAQYPQYDPQQAQYSGQYGAPQPPGPPRKSKRGLIIGLVVALVAVVGGGVTWLALSMGGKSGAASPGEAANTLMTAVQDGDLIGAMDALPPAEASVLSDMVADYVEELKRIEILDSSADASNVSGVDLEATEELKFDDAKAIKVNDHLTMAALTDGTLQLTGKFSDVPLAQSFKDAVIPPEVQAELESENPNETLDIGQMVQQTGQPIYIATTNVDGEWYPSLFHTIAYYALQDEGEQFPTTSTPAVGADSPNAALKALVEAVRTTDIQKVIEILPPDEMAVLHDLGPLLIEKVNADPESQQDLPFQLTKLETEESEVTGGTRSTVKSIEATFSDEGQTHTIAYTKDGDCYALVMDGQEEKFCRADIAEQLRTQLPPDVPQEVLQPLTEMVDALYERDFGVVTVEVDGKHYVSPLRTFSDMGLTLLKAVKPEHVKQLLQLIPR